MKRIDEIPPKLQWILGCLLGALLILAFLFLIYLAESWVNKHFFA